MATRQDYLTTAKALIDGLMPSTTDMGPFFDLAKDRVDRAKPRIVRLAITGDGGDEYSLGSDWTDRLSRVDEREGGVQYLPDNDSDDPYEQLTEEQYRIEKDSSGNPQIRFSFSFDSSDRMIVYHTARHTISDASSTLDPQDDAPFAELIAALAIRTRIARVLSDKSQRTDADRLAVDVAQSQELRALYHDLKRSAYAHFGLRDSPDGSGEVAGPASAFADADQRLSWRGTTRRYRHTHGRFHY